MPPEAKRGVYQNAEAPGQAGERPCGMCGGAVDRTEEYIAAACSQCGASSYHLSCVQDFIVAKSQGFTNSILRKKVKEKAQRRPQEEFCSHKCPDGVYLGHWEGRGTGRHWEGPVCSGHIISADWVKPQKADKKAAAPKPAPPPAAAQQRQQGARPAPAPGPAGPKKQKGPAGAAGAGAPSSLARSDSGKAVAAGPSKGKPSPSAKVPGGPGWKNDYSLSFAPGAGPSHLRLCKFFDEGGCHMHNCQFAHGKEELAEREAEWREEQAWLRNQKKAAEREAKKAALEDHIANQQALMPLSEEAFECMKAYKLDFCLNYLLEMGFTVDTSRAAAQATGGLVSAAVHQLTVGPPAAKGAKKPVDVSREAEALLQTALELGLTAAAVEAKLLAAGGSWHAVEENLQDQAYAQRRAEAAASKDEAGPAEPQAAAGEEGWSFGDVGEAEEGPAYVPQPAAPASSSFAGEGSALAASQGGEAVSMQLAPHLLPPTGSSSGGGSGGDSIPPPTPEQWDPALVGGTPLSLGGGSAGASSHGGFAGPAQPAGAPAQSFTLPSQLAPGDGFQQPPPPRSPLAPPASPPVSGQPALWLGSAQGSQPLALQPGQQPLPAHLQPNVSLPSPAPSFSVPGASFPPAPGLAPTAGASSVGQDPPAASSATYDAGYQAGLAAAMAQLGLLHNRAGGAPPHMVVQPPPGPSQASNGPALPLAAPHWAAPPQPPVPAAGGGWPSAPQYAAPAAAGGFGTTPVLPPPIDPSQQLGQPSSYGPPPPLGAPSAPVAQPAAPAWAGGAPAVHAAAQLPSSGGVQYGGFGLAAQQVQQQQQQQQAQQQQEDEELHSLLSMQQQEDEELHSLLSMLGVG